MKSELTQDRLRELFDYDQDTGVFTRKVFMGGTARAGSIAGSKHCRGYIVISVDHKRYLAHRLAWLYVHGTWPIDNIDHVNLNRMDNRITNLREASTADNNYNQAIRCDNTSGIKGVSWVSKRRKWLAQCSVNGKNKNLGLYEDKMEAKCVVEKYREANHGEFANHG